MNAAISGTAKTAAFARLGIAPSRDVKTIKRAYALALKAVDQASEREAFERLRQAYEQALAWAALADESNDTPDANDGRDDDDEDGEYERHSSRGDQSAPSTLDIPSPAVAPGPRAAASAPVPPITPGTDEARQALRHWIDQLRDASSENVAAVLEAAMSDSRLLHLDSYAQLESRIADLLHSDPKGRAALFAAAAARFHWSDRSARPFASTAAANWISRVVNQGLQWTAQKPAVIELKLNALDTVTRIASPDAEQVRRCAMLLGDMASDFPDWFALHLGARGHAHLQAWQAVQAKLSRRQARQLELQERYFGTRKKLAKTLVSGFFALLMVAAAILFLMSRLSLDNAAPAQTAISGDAQAGVGVPPPTPQPVLAYEYTGAVTQDSCANVEEFVHESNWLQVDDSDAMALLTSRAIRCQDKNMWLRKDDVLMTCLRAERAVALSAGRSESFMRCLPAEAGK